MTDYGRRRALDHADKQLQKSASAEATEILLRALSVVVDDAASVSAQAKKVDKRKLILLLKQRHK